MKKITVTRGFNIRRLNYEIQLDGTLTNIIIRYTVNQNGINKGSEKLVFTYNNYDYIYDPHIRSLILSEKGRTTTELYQTGRLLTHHKHLLGQALLGLTDERTKDLAKRFELFFQ